MTDQIVSTPLGVIRAHWNGHRLVSIQVTTDECLASTTSQRTQPPESMSSFKDPRPSLEAEIRKYFDSGQIDWPLDSLNWDGVSEFQRGVLIQCHKIPCGETISYGALARRAGYSGAARGVGRVMAKNPWPILIPCHRVVGASGKLTGYSAGDGLTTKRWLLEFEREMTGLPLGA